MRYVLFVCLAGLVIAFVIGLLAAPPEDPLASNESPRAASLLATVGSGLRAFGSAMREYVKDRVGEFTNPYRERILHESSTPSPSQ